jgi:hypothetical protein
MCGFQNPNLTGLNEHNYKIQAAVFRIPVPWVASSEVWENLAIGMSVSLTWTLFNDDVTNVSILHVELVRVP